jgi:UDP-glucose 4-epimerase
VFFSTIAVYGRSGGRILTEDTPPCPNTFYARTKLDAEEIVLAAKDAHGRPIGTVLRLGAVYGSKMKGNYRRLVHALATGRFIPVGKGSNRRTLIYDRDVARAAVLAAVHPDAAGLIFNVTDGQFHTMRSIIETLCGALDRRPPHLTLPAEPVRVLAGLLEDSGRMFGLHSPVTRATVDKYTEDMAVEGKHFCTLTGFIPQYNLEAGWCETVAEMRQSGEI